MDWTDDAIVLAVRPHGESAGVAELLTAERGRHAGLVHGARGRALRPVLQPGNGVRAAWRARLADHLGSMTVEPLELRAGRLLDDPLQVAGLQAVCALTLSVLPEREPYPGIYAALQALLGAMEVTPDWPALMVKWEAGLLDALGYGLDLTECALTGSTDDLTHVSPASGRAVCGRAREAAPYLDKLLKLPPFLLGAQAALAPGDVADGLRLTGHFLQRRVLWPADRRLPDARATIAAAVAPPEPPQP